MPTAFRAGRWICRPASVFGWLISAAALAYLVTVFIAIDRHSHSVSDTLYAFFPQAAAAFLLWDWIARRSSASR